MRLVFSQTTGGMEMKMKQTARTVPLSTLFTALLVPSAVAEETMRIDLQTALAKAFATHADIKKAEYSLDAARADYNAARESFGPKVTLSQSTSRGGYWDERGNTAGTQYSKQIGNTYNSGVSLSVFRFFNIRMGRKRLIKGRLQVDFHRLFRKGRWHQ